MMKAIAHMTLIVVTILLFLSFVVIHSSKGEAPTEKPSILEQINWDDPNLDFYFDRDSR